MKEAESLIKDGVREITLLGQNVNSYGKDFKNGYGFSSLLRDVANPERSGACPFCKLTAAGLYRGYRTSYGVRTGCMPFL